MKTIMKSTFVSILVPLLFTSYLVIPKVSAGGPVTSDFLVKIFYDPTTENWALDTGEIDINDWPLSSAFIERWAGRSDITMDEYAEIGKMEIDINNQWWPTGPNDPTHTSAAARNIFYNPAGVRDVASLHFRRAVAHLTNKAKFTTTFMGGMGYPVETMVPVPALEGFTDYSSLTNDTAKAARGDNPLANGFIYQYDRAAAINELELGGFHDWDGDGVREWNKNYPNTWRGSTDTEELPNMRFWIRLDDPDRRQAGEDLYNEMVAVGIPAATGSGGRGVEKIVTERVACYLAVMVNYDYNFYTGGWSLTADLDFIYDLYHSSMGQYAWAQNYVGFKNAEFDGYAEKIKYPKSLADVKHATIQAQWVAAKYVPVIELWSAKGVKAYRTGWQGVVNMAGFGIDNSWSFQLMNWTDGPGTSRSGPANTIVWGFKSDISELNVFTSEWLWDWNVLGQIYDSLIGRNPFDLSEEVGLLAQGWNTTSVDWDANGRLETIAEFTLRTDATFNDGSQVKPADVAFSLLAARDMGAGTAWNYPAVMNIAKVEILGQTIKVYFSVESAWALHWAGFMPIVNKDLWNQAIGTGTTAGYTGFIPDDTHGVYTGGTFPNAAAVRNYHPWEVSTYGNPAIIDLAEDGGGPWKFASYVPGQTVRLTGNTAFYTEIWEPFGRKLLYPLDYDWPGTGKRNHVANFIEDAFHKIGNVNFAQGYGKSLGWYATNRKIDLTDLSLIAKSMPSSTGTNTSLWPEANWGNGPNQYNIDADVTQDYNVNIVDLVTAGLNFNKKQG